MARFKNEARAAGRLHHPNIVGIYEYGEDENVAFIAMEYVEGTGLREYLDRKARFDFGAGRRRSWRSSCTRSNSRTRAASSIATSSRRISS